MTDKKTNADLPATPEGLKQNIEQGFCCYRFNVPEFRCSNKSTVKVAYFQLCDKCHKRMMDKAASLAKGKKQ